MALVIMHIFILHAGILPDFFVSSQLKIMPILLTDGFKILKSSLPGKFFLPCCPKYLALEQQNVGIGGGNELAINS